MKMEALVLEAQKLLIWSGVIPYNCKELQKYENLSGPKHSLPVGSSEKDFFELFVTNNFFWNTIYLESQLNGGSRLGV